MIHVTLPPGLPARRLPFYLAMEEWVASSLPADDYLFTWIVEPTVIFGRNQMIDKEVDREYCRSNGIDIVRRKSGGGCVYADLDNIMFSYITPRQDVAGTFVEYTDMIVAMLAAQGIKAESTGRNDICIDGRKVAGNAFYHVPGRSIVHGTMLYSTNLSNMLRAITPSKSKLESKQVQSVESHITTLERYLDIPIETFRSRAIAFLTDTTLELTPDQVKEIEAIERTYYAPGWLENGDISSARHAQSHSGSSETRRIEGVGELSLTLTLDASLTLIDSITLAGDFFAFGEKTSETLTALIRGLPVDKKTLVTTLADASIDTTIIRGLKPEMFADLIISVASSLCINQS